MHRIIMYDLVRPVTNRVIDLLFRHCLPLYVTTMSAAIVSYTAANKT